MIAQMAPAIRVSLASSSTWIGSQRDHKVSTALRRIGFKNVFDTDFTADLTIMEEGSEWFAGSRPAARSHVHLVLSRLDQVRRAQLSEFFRISRPASRPSR
jgi:iron only hydrogenase large subunit-like protein